MEWVVLEIKGSSISLLELWITDQILIKPDNSEIYVQGLSDNVTLDDLKRFFKLCGTVRMNKRPGQAMINICMDKETGKPKCDATVSYKTPPSTNSAMEWRWKRFSMKQT